MPIELNTATAKGLEITFNAAKTVAATGPTHAALSRAARLNTALDSALNWYWEVFQASASSSTQAGMGVDKTVTFIADWSTVAGGYMYYGADGNVYNAGSPVSYGKAYGAGAIIGVQMRAGKLYFYRNGIIQNNGDPVAGTGYAYAGLTGSYYPALWMYNENMRLGITLDAGSLYYPLPAGASAIQAGGSLLFSNRVEPAPVTLSTLFAGSGYIAGTLKIAGVLTEGYVTVIHRRSQKPIQTQWAVGGVYLFQGLDPDHEFDVRGGDPNRGYKDYIEPAVRPTL